MEWLVIAVFIVFVLGVGIVTRDAIKHAKKTSTPNKSLQRPADSRR